MKYALDEDDILISPTVEGYEGASIEWKQEYTNEQLIATQHGFRYYKYKKSGSNVVARDIRCYVNTAGQVIVVEAGTEPTGYTEKSEADIKLDAAKAEAIKQISEDSFRLRKALIPDYKFDNAQAGIYDTQENTDILNNYKFTVKAFRAAYYAKESEINAATQPSDINTNVDWPTEIVTS